MKYMRTILEVIRKFRPEVERYKIYGRPIFDPLIDFDE